MSVRTDRSPATAKLVFAWPTQHEVHLLLPAMIALALVLHICALLLFQLIYPEANSAQPEAARVLVPGARTPDWKSSIAWIQAADPAIFASTRTEEVLPIPPSPRPYVPSFMGSRLELRLPDESESELPAPGLMKLPQVASANKASTGSAEPAPSPEKKSVRLTINGKPASLDSFVRHSEKIPDAQPSAPAFFLAFVGEDGTLRNLFLQSTSGSAAWDSWAADALSSETIDVAAESSPWVWIAVELEKTPALPLPGADNSLQLP
jgi:hypothetical protein